MKAIIKKITNDTVEWKPVTQEEEEKFIREIFEELDKFVSSKSEVFIKPEIVNPDCPIIGHEWRTIDKEQEGAKRIIENFLKNKKDAKSETPKLFPREIELLIYAVDKKIRTYNRIIDEEGDKQFIESVTSVRDEYINLFYKLVLFK